MNKVMVLGRSDLKSGAKDEKWVSLDSFQMRATAGLRDCDFVLYVNGRDIQLLKSRWSRRGLRATVKWVESQSQWISLVKSA